MHSSALRPSDRLRPATWLGLVLVGFACIIAGNPTSVSASDWLTHPSTYSHDPATGMRVSQYAPVAAPVAPAVSNFRTSGYTHTRSSLNYGPSADNYHRVEAWGEPVRPYGEWQFPYRPYSSPYPNWGPPYAGLNLGLGGVYPGYGPGSGGAGYPPSGAGFPPRGSGYPPGGAGHPSRGPGISGQGRGGYPAGQGGVRPNRPNHSAAGPGSPYQIAPNDGGFHPVYPE
ncbi:hypothetical protein [Rubripirellula lacrimiformis]|uniref:hypothetical protein n=1 Tax=Rubripirellula lacrimiformis TaxID=1930273 RepID=UPI001FEB6600|nr:hypothetical protein [Rubripirellula lacrimiformis]